MVSLKFIRGLRYFYSVYPKPGAGGQEAEILPLRQIDWFYHIIQLMKYM